MKVFLFKYSDSLVYVLSAVVVLLVITGSLLYMQKNKTQAHNRLLVLQNDSILSEHIKLKNSTLERSNTGTENKLKLSSISLEK